MSSALISLPNLPNEGTFALIETKVNTRKPSKQINIMSSRFEINLFLMLNFIPILVLNKLYKTIHIPLHKWSKLGKMNLHSVGFEPTTHAFAASVFPLDRGNPLAVNILIYK